MILRKYLGDDYHERKQPRQISDESLVAMWDELLQVMEPLTEQEEQSVLDFMRNFNHDFIRSCDLGAYGPIKDAERSSDVLHAMWRKGSIQLLRISPSTYALKEGERAKVTRRIAKKDEEMRARFEKRQMETMNNEGPSWTKRSDTLPYG